MLSGELLSTVFIPDTEEVTGSIPVSPTSTKKASEQRKCVSEALLSASAVIRFGRMVYLLD